MTVATPLDPLTLSARIDQMFPRLTAPQVARIAAHGRVRPVAPGEVLIDVGDAVIPFFVVTTGEVEIYQPADGQESLVTRHGPGQFSGEVNMLAGRRSLVRARVSQPGEVIELPASALLTLVQTDSELGEIIMRAFILRRVELIAHGLGAVLLGSNHSAGTLRIKEFLSRNGHPYTYLDLDRDGDVQGLLDRFHVGPEDIPVLICCGGDTGVLRNPTNEQLADSLGLNAQVDAAQVRDLIILGAGPSGLAAAVYGASEGLDVLVLEASAPGGQAGSSSKIENYLGFPTGISGQALAGRAYNQAQKFGARVLIAKHARRLDCSRRPYAVEVDAATRYLARAVIVATGAEYRKLTLPEVGRFEGTGIYYGATYVEAQLCQDDDVVVIGGGNSAGQAAVFLAQTARHVHMLVRASGLADSMSRYLIRRIEENPAITLRCRTQITALEGDSHLQRVRWRHHPSGEETTAAVRHVFCMMGAIPSTQWLDGCTALDGKGFIKTGSELTPEDLETARWPLARAPHLLETSLPGVFAVGDVRCGSVKRVASAVGEGSIAVSFVHRVLAE